MGNGDDANKVEISPNELKTEEEKADEDDDDEDAVDETNPEEVLEPGTTSNEGLGEVEEAEDVGGEADPTVTEQEGAAPNPDGESGVRAADEVNPESDNTHNSQSQLLPNGAIPNLENNT